MTLPRLTLLLLLTATPIVAAAPDTVTAKALGPAPGAIVCRDLATVSEMFDLYAQSWEDRMQAVLTGGASTRVNGAPLPPPNLARY
jgi:hypothetical protein